MKRRSNLQEMKLLSEQSQPNKQENPMASPFTYKVMWVYAFLVTGFVALGLQNIIYLGTLFRDPLAVTGGEFYFGFFSSIGVLIWCASAVTCFFSSLILEQLNHQHSWRLFLLTSGCLTSLLLLDDLFLIHEEFFPKYLGVPSEGIFGIYGVVIILYLVRFYKMIQRTEHKLFLIAAFLCMAISLLIDGLIDAGLLDSFNSSLLANGRDYLFEDGMKLLGIVSWLIYFGQVSFQRVMYAFQSRN